MSEDPVLKVVFFRAASGREPVRQWLRDLSREDRKVIGEDLKLVQFRWPLGMPLVRKMEANLWEVRCNLSKGRTARVLFTAGGSEMALLHGYIKKSRRTPQGDLSLARPKRPLAERGIVS